MLTLGTVIIYQNITNECSSRSTVHPGRLLVTNTIPGNFTKRSFISLALVLSKCPDPLIHLPSNTSSSSTAISIWFPKPVFL